MMNLSTWILFFIVDCLFIFVCLARTLPNDDLNRRPGYWDFLVSQNSSSDNVNSIDPSDKPLSQHGPPLPPNPSQFFMHPSNSTINDTTLLVGEHASSPTRVLTAHNRDGSNHGGGHMQIIQQPSNNNGLASILPLLALLGQGGMGGGRGGGRQDGGGGVDNSAAIMAMIMSMSQTNNQPQMIYHQGGRNSD